MGWDEENRRGHDGETVVTTSTVAVYTEADHISPFPAMLTRPRSDPPLSNLPPGPDPNAIFRMILSVSICYSRHSLSLPRLPRHPRTDWGGGRMASGRRQTGGDKRNVDEEEADEDSNVLIAVLPEIK